MKKIGLIGGMSWESTLHYYRAINQRVAEKLGGLHSAELTLQSIDFAPIAELQKQGEWDKTGDILAEAALACQSSGAEGVVLCTNTMHIVAETIESQLDIPFHHIVDATGEHLVANGVSKVGLLATAFTMQMPFYRQRLTDKFGIEVVVPDLLLQDEIHRIIFEELCLGKVLDTSRTVYQQAVDELAKAGAEGVILGCTEIGMLLEAKDASLPLYDSVDMHVDSVVEWALA